MTITDHYRATAQWLRQWAESYDTGKAQHQCGGVDDSKQMAGMLRHKARNIEAVITSYERLKP